MGQLRARDKAVSHGLLIGLNVKERADYSAVHWREFRDVAARDYKAELANLLEGAPPPPPSSREEGLEEAAKAILALKDEPQIGQMSLSADFIRGIETACVNGAVLIRALIKSLPPARMTEDERADLVSDIIEILDKHRSRVRGNRLSAESQFTEAIEEIKPLAILASAEGQ